MIRRSRSGTRAVIYARISKRSASTDDEGVSLSIGRQVDDCRALAAALGLTVVAVSSDDDLGASTRTRGGRPRPGYAQALARAEGGDCDVVLAYSNSRLTRRPLELEDLITLYERTGVVVRTVVSGDDDLSTADGRMVARIKASVDAAEAERISERTQRALRQRVENGLTAGGKPPIGYRWVGEGVPFGADPTYGPVVRSMYTDYLRGHGPQRIARDLNADGVRTPRGREFGVVSVTRVLDSGFAAGYLPVDVKGEDRRERGAHEALIDEATWAAYQRERDRRRQVHPKARQPRWSLGGGLTTCGLCGANLYVNSYSDRHGQAICSRYKSSRTCAGVWLNRVRLEGLVALWLGAHVQEWADRTDEATGADDQRDRLAKELDAARADEDRLARGRREAARLLALGDVDEDDYRAAVRTADARRAQVAGTIIGIESELAALSPGADVYDRIERGSAGMTTEEWNAVLRRLIRRIAVTPTEITLTPWHGERRIWDRTVVTPRRPARESETPRGQNGRFVGGATPG